MDKILQALHERVSTMQKSDNATPTAEAGKAGQEPLALCKHSKCARKSSKNKFQEQVPRTSSKNKFPCSTRPLAVLAVGPQNKSAVSLAAVSLAAVSLAAVSLAAVSDVVL